MRNLSESAETIIEQKPSNWEMLLFAQLLSEKVAVCRLWSRPDRANPIIKTVGVGLQRKTFSEVISRSMGRFSSIASKQVRDSKKAMRLLEKMKKSRSESRVISYAEKAAYLMTTGYSELAPEYLNMLIIDVPLSCMPALREMRCLAKAFLSRLDDSYVALFADINDAALRASSGEDQIVTMTLDLDDLDIGRLTGLIERNARLYSRTSVRVKSVEELIREHGCSIESSDSIDKMEGIEFERFCARLLAANGYENVEVTSCSGDQGVDILCEKDRVSYAIQCKRFDSLVGNGAVQEVYAGRQLYHCNVGVVMTNSDFTTSARELAEATGVALWGRDVVLKMARAMRDSGL